MIGTSRTESRCQCPSDSGSNTGERLNAVDSMVANIVSDQSVGAPQHELGIDAAVGTQGPPAEDPVLGVRVGELQQGAQRSRKGERVGVQEQQPLAARRLRPAVHAAREPEVLARVDDRGRGEAPPGRRAALPSVEPLSTTISSRSTLGEAWSTDRRQADVASRVL